MMNWLQILSQYLDQFLGVRSLSLIGWN